MKPPKRLKPMRPITNILLVLALICYLFLPFYEISLNGTVTGLSFTAGSISQWLSANHVLLVLVPFIACFGAVTMNCLKSRWWILAAIVFIIAWLLFYTETNGYHHIVLQHAPEVTPDSDLGEGFAVTGLGIGYKLSAALVGLSLLSAIVSLLPFKFNETIEKAVDDTFEDGRRHVREEFKRFESSHRSHKTKGNTANSAEQPSAPAEQPQTQEEDKEYPARFMPK